MMARARGRSYEDFADVTAAELEVIAAAREGRVARFDDTIPATPKRKRATRVRASIVRFLMLGGDEQHPVHESGVQVWGAYILGDLDLSDCTLSHNLELSQCYLAGQLILRGSRTRVISLQASRCDGVDADSVDIGGELYLCAGTCVTGVVRLVGATIKGSLECQNAQFLGFDADGDTLICDRSTIGGSVFLSKAFAIGNIRFVGATIKGVLMCEGSQLGYMPAAIAPANWNREVLNLQRLTVNGTVHLGNRKLPDRLPARFDGGINFTSAKIGALIDDVSTVKPKPGEPDYTPPAFVKLDGFTYERFGEATDLSTDARTAFLRLQPENDLRSEFKYRPWTQMTTVLHAAGHETAAKKVAIERQRMLRRAGHTGVLHFLYGISYGYGYRPWYLAGWAVLFAVLFALFFSMAAAKGVMAPTDRRVLDDPHYAACRRAWVVHWTKCEPLQSRYSAFNPLLYSIELIVPIAGQQQAKDWAPLLKRPCSKIGMFGFCKEPMPNTPRDPNSSAPLGYWWLGILATVLARVETVLGWLAGLMFVAVASGLIKKD